jgi:hypothetical protein
MWFDVMRLNGDGGGEVVMELWNNKVENDKNSNTNRII